MGYFYTDQLVTRLQAGATLHNVSLTMHLMSRAPVIEDNDGRAALRGVTTLASLTALAGWDEVSTTGYVPMATTTPTISVGANRYVQLNTTLLQFVGMADAQVEAVVYCVDGAAIGLSAGQVVLFGSTTPFGEKTIFRSGDGVSAGFDTTVSARWLFGYAIDAAVVTSVVEGTTVIQQGSPPFEVSHVHHVWLYPQRANLIANPSFEAGVTHWQSSAGPVTRTNMAQGPSPWVGMANAYYGSGVPASGILNPAQRLYVKSAPFYPRGETLTFQLTAVGSGTMRVAIAYYPRDYSEYAADWGLKDSLAFEEWVLSNNTWTQVKGIRRMSDGYEAALLIEVRPFSPGGFPMLYFDKVMVEEGTLLDWEYFDGDTTYGAEDDYSWYGDTTVSAKRGKSYSMYYNNRRAIAGRLFGRRLDDTAQYTSYDEQLDSLVSHWTPAGAVVMPHWDVLDEHDMRLLPADRSATVLPITIWPEQTQPFTLYDLEEVTATSAVVSVTGEGDYPVTGGYIVVAGVSYPLTIGPRSAAVAARSALHDTTSPQSIDISWPAVPTGTQTIYLYRGPAESPLSFVTTVGAGVVPVGTSSYPSHAAATGAAFNPTLVISSHLPAGLAAASGTAYNPSPTGNIVSSASAQAAAAIGLAYAPTLSGVTTQWPIPSSLSQVGPQFAMTASSTIHLYGGQEYVGLNFAAAGPVGGVQFHGPGLITLRHCFVPINVLYPEAGRTIYMDHCSGYGFAENGGFLGITTEWCYFIGNHVAWRPKGLTGDWDVSGDTTMVCRSTVFASQGQQEPLAHCEGMQAMGGRYLSYTGCVFYCQGGRYKSDGSTSNTAAYSGYSADTYVTDCLFGEPGAANFMLYASGPNHYLTNVKVGVIGNPGAWRPVVQEDIYPGATGNDRAFLDGVRIYS